MSTSGFRLLGLVLLFLIIPPHAAPQPCLQPLHRAAIVATDGSAGPDTLWLGYHPLATCGIDTAFCGEDIEPPPPPPTGVFYPCWFSMSCIKNLWWDYVDADTMDTHGLRWQQGVGSATFRWSPDSIRTICDSAVIVDQFGGLFVRKRMDRDSSVAITMPGVTSLMIIRYGRRGHDPVTVPVTIHPGWNLISNPVLTRNDTVVSLFPVCLNYVFVWDGLPGWRQTHRLPLGTGAWNKCFSTGQAHITGEPVYLDSTGVMRGWNFVGSISYPVPTATVKSIPPGIIDSPFFWHDGHHYVVADTIVPGFAYWVKVSASGTLLLQANGGY